MDIHTATITPFRLSLRLPLETAHGTTRVRLGALLQIRDASGVLGFGESMPLPGFGLESLAASHEALCRAGRALCREQPDSLGAALAVTARCTPSAPAARAALETALLDLTARLRSVSVAALLGGPRRNCIETNALLAARTPREVGAAAREAVQQGFRTLKLKVAATTLDRDVARVKGARAAVGPDIALRLDANGGWDEETASQALERLAPMRPEYVEQPVDATALDAMMRLRARSPIPIAADEAASSPAAARAIIARRAADLLILKPAVLGGPRTTQGLAQHARTAGIDTVVTSFLDSAVGDAAALQLAAALGGPARAAGLGGPTLFHGDLATRRSIAPSPRPLPPGPGLGVTPDPALLARQRCGEPVSFARC